MRTWSERGFSLIEVMIVAGLMGLVALGTAAQLKTGFMGQKTLQAQDDARVLTGDIATILSDGTACTNTFAGVNPVTGGTISAVKDKTGATRYATNSVYGNRTLTLSNLTVGGSGVDGKSNITKWVTSSATQGRAFISVDWTQTGANGNSGTGPSRLYRYFLVDAVIDGSNQIVSCNAQIGPQTMASSGSGDANYVSLWLSSTVLGNSVMYQNGTKIGIGTTAPAEALHISSESGTNAGIKLSSNGGTTTNTLKVIDGALGGLQVQNGAGTTMMSFNNTDQKVGIGTSNPSSKFHVQQTTDNSSGGVRISDSSDAVGVQLWSDGSRARLDGGTTGVSDILLNGSGTGNVGIGTTTPGAKLHVNGSVRIVDGNQAAGKVLTSDASGNGTWQTASGGSPPAGTAGSPCTSAQFPSNKGITFFAPSYLGGGRSCCGTVDNGYAGSNSLYCELY